VQEKTSHAFLLKKFLLHRQIKTCVQEKTSYACFAKRARDYDADYGPGAHRHQAKSKSAKV